MRCYFQSLLRMAAFGVAILIAPLTALTVWSEEHQDEPDVHVFLPKIEAQPGEVVDVLFRMQSEIPISMISWSVEYDVEVLEFVEAILSPDIHALIADRPAEETRFISLSIRRPTGHLSR